MILAFAGRRAQSMTGDLEAVATRLRRLLSALRPTAVVGAAADGGDLLVVEAALATEGVDVHLILPTPVDVFREASVAPAWRERFERVLAEVASVESLGLEDGADAYRQANTAFLDRAAELAGDDGEVIVLVIAAEGQGAMVQDLIDSGQRRGAPTLRIDPEVSVEPR
jgi:hypothetical protein